MKNIDIKKVIIISIVPIIIGTIGYFVLSSFFNEDKAQSIDELTTFFPFNEESGGFDADGNILTTTSSLIDRDTSTDSIPVLRQITSSPTAGAIIFSPKVSEEGDTENYSIIRYIEKATGHIYETTTNSPSQIRISNTTIPQIHKSLWLDKQSLIIRYLDDSKNIKTFSAELIMDDLGDQKLEGVFLQDNIREIIKFDEQIFCLLDSGERSMGVISDKENEDREIIFESPLKEWLITNVDDRYINFTTKPAITTTGYSFLFDTTTGKFDKIIGGKSNLSTLINKSFDILYSEYDKLGPKLYLYNNEEKTNTEIPIQTFPEKCVWDKEDIYIYCGIPLKELSNSDLTRWYKGLTSFSDDIWKINTETQTTEFLISPREFEVGDIDMINPILNEDGDYLLFTNKRDYSLWGLRLKKEL